MQNLQLIASNEVTINECVKRGHMDYQVAAAGKNLLGNALNSWSYDPNAYQVTFASYTQQAQNIAIDKPTCDMLAVSIVQQHQQQQQLAQQRQQQQFNQSMQALRDSTPKTTYCNRIGSQTICNTY